MHVDGDCDVEIGAAWSSVDIECNDSEMQCCVVYGEEDPEPEPLSPCSEVDGRCIHFDGDCDVEIGVAWSSVDIECNDWEMQCCVVYGEEDPETEPLSPCSEVDGRCIGFEGDCDVEIGAAWSSVDIECNDWEMQCCVIYGE